MFTHVRLCIRYSEKGNIGLQKLYKSKKIIVHVLLCIYIYGRTVIWFSDINRRLDNPIENNQASAIHVISDSTTIVSRWRTRHLWTTRASCLIQTSREQSLSNDALMHVISPQSNVLIGNLNKLWIIVSLVSKSVRLISIQIKVNNPKQNSKSCGKPQLYLDISIDLSNIISCEEIEHTSYWKTLCKQISIVDWKCNLN